MRLPLPGEALLFVLAPSCFRLCPGSLSADFLRGEGVLFPSGDLAECLRGGEELDLLREGGDFDFLRVGGDFDFLRAGEDFPFDAAAGLLLFGRFSGFLLKTPPFSSSGAALTELLLLPKAETVSEVSFLPITAT